MEQLLPFFHLLPFALYSSGLHLTFSVYSLLNTGEIMSQTLYKGWDPYKGSVSRPQKTSEPFGKGIEVNGV